MVAPPRCNPLRRGRLPYSEASEVRVSAFMSKNRNAFQRLYRLLHYSTNIVGIMIKTQERAPRSSTSAVQAQLELVST